KGRKRGRRWFQYMKLIDTTDAILDGIKATTTENLPQLEDNQERRLDSRSARAAWVSCIERGTRGSTGPSASRCSIPRSAGIQRAGFRSEISAKKTFVCSIIGAKSGLPRSTPECSTTRGPSLFGL